MNIIKYARPISLGLRARKRFLHIKELTCSRNSRPKHNLCLIAGQWYTSGCIGCSADRLASFLGARICRAPSTVGATIRPANHAIHLAPSLTTRLMPVRRRTLRAGSMRKQYQRYITYKNVRDAATFLLLCDFFLLFAINTTVQLTGAIVAVLLVGVRVYCRIKLHAPRPTAISEYRRITYWRSTTCTVLVASAVFTVLLGATRDYGLMAFELLVASLVALHMVYGSRFLHNRPFN